MRHATPPNAAFDLFSVPVDGLVRIEASAGTGKTHTLADLYLRLVGEGGRSVDQILVVTYTVAATGELRERIRRRLAEARAHLDGRPTDDPVLQRLRERSQERSAVARRLAEALHSFDEAAVITIHGFCQRVLAEFAFESGQPFTTELVPDEHDLLQEVVDDFWRIMMPGWRSSRCSGSRWRRPGSYPWQEPPGCCCIETADRYAKGMTRARSLPAEKRRNFHDAHLHDRDPALRIEPVEADAEPAA